MIRFSGMGTVSRKTDLAYSQDGKPYIFFSVDSPKQYVKEGSKPLESNDFSIFGPVAEEFDAAVNVGDTVMAYGTVQRRKRDEKWETQLLIDEVQVGGRLINYSSAKKN